MKKPVWKGEKVREPVGGRGRELAMSMLVLAALVLQGYYRVC